MNEHQQNVIRLVNALLESSGKIDENLESLDKKMMMSISKDKRHLLIEPLTVNAKSNAEIDVVRDYLRNLGLASELDIQHDDPAATIDMHLLKVDLDTYHVTSDRHKKGHGLAANTQRLESMVERKFELRNYYELMTKLNKVFGYTDLDGVFHGAELKNAGLLPQTSIEFPLHGVTDAKIKLVEEITKIVKGSIALRGDTIEIPFTRLMTVRSKLSNMLDDYQQSLNGDKIEQKQSFSRG